MRLCPIIIFLYTKDSQYSPECLAKFLRMFEDIFPGMFGDIPRNVWRHSSECLRTFPGIFDNIPQNIWRYSGECLATLPEMFGTLPGMFRDIPQNAW